MTSRPSTPTRNSTAPGMCLAATRRGVQTITRKVSPMPRYIARLTPGQAQKIEDTAWLLSFGTSPDEIARRLGTSVTTLGTLLRAAHREDLARPFVREAARNRHSGPQAPREAVQDALPGLVKGAAA